MGNGFVNVKYSNKFIEVDACIRCPIEIAGSIKLTIEGSRAPNAEERTFDCYFFEVLSNFGNYVQ